MPENLYGLRYNQEWYHKKCLDNIKSKVPELIVRKPISGNPKCNACGKLLKTTKPKLVPPKAPKKPKKSKKSSKKPVIKKIEEVLDKEDNLKKKRN